MRKAFKQYDEYKNMEYNPAELLLGSLDMTIDWELFRSKVAKAILDKIGDWQLVGTLEGDNFAYYSYDKDKPKSYIRTTRFPNKIEIEIAIREVKK